jgi:monoamine oxidase
VIFTPSLGVLKKNYLTLFSPQLPTPMITAIKAMGFGTIGKVFLEFSTPFWNQHDWVGYGFLWTSSDVKEIKGTSREWLLDLQAFTKVDAFPNLLEALLGGEHQANFESLSDATFIDDCMWMLEKFLNKTLPRPKSMVRTNWLTHKNFLGSYSYKSMEAMRRNITPAHLAQSLSNKIGKPELLFAGEATDLLFSSNAHGAVNSGFRVAREIIDYNAKKSCDWLKNGGDF